MMNRLPPTPAAKTPHNRASKKKNRFRYARALAMMIPAVFGFTSCATRSVPSGESLRGAIIDTIPSNEDTGRIRGAAIISLNGEKVAGRGDARVKAGKNRVTIQLAVSKAGKQEVDLQFHARSTGRYFLKFISYPQRSYRGSDDYHKSTSAESVLSLAELDPTGGYLGAALIVPAIGMAFAEPVYRSLRDNVGMSHPVEYVDILIVSEDPGEGIVSRVRFNPKRTNRASNPLYPRPSGGAGAEGLKKRIHQ